MEFTTATGLVQAFSRRCSSCQGVHHYTAVGPDSLTSRGVWLVQSRGRRHYRRRRPRRHLCPCVHKQPEQFLVLPKQRRPQCQVSPVSVLPRGVGAQSDDFLRRVSVPHIRQWRVPMEVNGVYPPIPVLAQQRADFSRIFRPECLEGVQVVHVGTPDSALTRASDVRSLVLVSGGATGRAGLIPHDNSARLCLTVAQKKSASGLTLPLA